VVLFSFDIANPVTDIELMSGNDVKVGKHLLYLGVLKFLLFDQKADPILLEMNQVELKVIPKMPCFVLTWD
jgi:hypothetical protein